MSKRKDWIVKAIDQAEISSWFVFDNTRWSYFSYDRNEARLFKSREEARQMVRDLKADVTTVKFSYENTDNPSQG